MSVASPDFIALQIALAGEYALQRELGRGGMGVVYLARDVHLDRDVAIKVLPSNLAEQPGLRERFLREARTAAGLSHPNIVPIHRVGEAGGFVFFVMAYVPGRTLGERLRSDGPAPAAESMRIMREVAWALAYAHERGIIHRDIKPDNILIEEGSGRALVTDFGIAQSSAAVESTDPGRVLGTAHFMSPEQARDESVDGRSDLYSLGVVGYLAVSGRLPFEAPNLPALLVKQATAAPEGLASIAPGVPNDLAIVIDRCLSSRREDRFDNGTQVATALEPRTDGARPLPPALHAWLRARNPAQPLYVGVSVLASVSLVRVAAMGLKGFAIARMGDWWTFPLLCLAMPVIPILGFHVMQARRLFAAGFSLADLRAAIARDETERRDAAVADDRAPLTLAQKCLRLATYASSVQSLISMMMMSAGVNGWKYGVEIASVVGTIVLLAACNVYNVPLLPAAIRRGPRSLRDRLWSSRAGAWIAKMLNAPQASTVVNEAAFRPTELVLSAAAGDLFAALPASFRQQLAELPAIVEQLEERAASARARLEELDALAVVGGVGTRDASVDLRVETRSALNQSVAALENIRLDLLRLHAGSSDVASLTTLLNAAAAAGSDVRRLADAQREVSSRLRRRNPLRETSLTPV